MELYIIRHGLTEWNAQKRFQGCTDIDLAEEGRLAAIELGEKLDDIEFDVIYSSPLGRAFETACLIRGRRNIRIKRQEELRELSFGIMEGCDYETWDDPKKSYRFLFTEPDKYEAPPEGESLEHIMARGKSFIQETIEPLEGKCKRVMIVAHGAMNKALMCYLEENDKAHFWGDGLQNNCQATIFELKNGLWSRS